MKRILKILGGLLLLVVLGLAALFYSAFGSNKSLPDSADLPGGARLVKDGMVAFFVLPAGADAVALVDCGNDSTGEKVLGELARRNLKPEAVKTIFLTHGHGDHIAGCHLFPKAEILALAEDVSLADGTQSSHGPLTRFFKNGADKAIKVTRALKDGEMVQTGELSVQVFAIPGHTAGSAAFLVGGVLYLGDSATHTKDEKLIGSPWAFSDSAEQNRASLRLLSRKLKEQHAEVKAMAFAHSAPMDSATALDEFAASKK